MSLGEESPKVVETLVQMGIILNARGEYDDALEVFHEALELKEDNLKSVEFTIDIAKIHNNIGCVHYESEDYEEAELQFEEALDIQEHLLEEQKFIGPEFLCMASTMCNLAFIYIDQGVDVMDECEEAMREDIGVDFEYAKSLFTKATQKLEDALVIQQGLLDGGHNLVLNSLDNMAYCLYRAHDYDNSIKYYKRLLKAQKLALGSDHVHVSDTLIKIAKVYLKLCQFEKSYKILEAVTKFYTKYLGRDDRRSVRTRAMCYSVEKHLKIQSSSNIFTGCNSVEEKMMVYNTSSTNSFRDRMIISLTRQNIKNPFTKKRLDCRGFLGELSPQFQNERWNIKRPQNMSKMSGQRVSFA